MTDPIAAVKQFFEGLNGPSMEETCKHLKANVTDDFVWENTGLPTQNGPEEAAAFLSSFTQALPGLTGLTVEYKAIAAAGNTVVTERIDRLVDGQGNVLVPIPLAGTLEVAADGRIKAWRDYFDPRPFV